MKKILYFVVSVILLAGCDGTAQKTASVITPRDFAEKLKNDPNPQLIDVRTPKEFADDHISGAKNIDWNGDNFTAEASQLDKSKPVYVYCKVGGRSAEAASKLKELGFSQVYDLKGGILKWKADGLSEPVAKGIGMTSEQFENLIASEEKVLINFHAAWCPACKKMAPYMSALEKDSKDVKIVRLDADENKSLVSEMKIDQLPMIVLYKNGKPQWQHKGYISESELKKQLQ